MSETYYLPVEVLQTEPSGEMKVRCNKNQGGWFVKLEELKTADDIKEDGAGEKKETLSVAKDIAALALINIQDIFQFVLSAKDEEIEKRYGTEEKAIEIAEKYIEIAAKASMLEYPLSGWSMEYSQPIAGSDERLKKTARFYDVKKEDDKNENL